LIGKSLAAKIARSRRRAPINSPADLLKGGVIRPEQLRRLEQATFGRVGVRPLITEVSCDKNNLYVNEPFSLRIRFSKGVLAAEVVTLLVRFPSGTTRTGNFRITEKDRRLASVVVAGLRSSESGEIRVLATLRDATGGVHQTSAEFGVFTRNPVQMFITPTFATQSGNAGAPQYNWDEDRWYCRADVRWVNGESVAVNLGRNVNVRMTDGGNEVDTFSFNLSGDIVVPAMSTVYGSIYTYHGSNTDEYDIFMDRGDLTYRYRMSGGGFTPTRNQIWRGMRVIGYNIIRVGDFTNTERSEYRRAAAEIASGILQSRDMTVYGVELYRIEGTTAMDADKARFRFIDSQSEINDLRDEYTVDNWYLDAFFVEGRWDGAFGSSPVGGPVDKEGNSSGLVIARDGDTVNLGQTFAHEGGHYLGLEHADESDGCDDTDPSDPNISDNFIFSSSRRDSAVITGCQINKMRKHGLVKVMTP
jgi:hypothetical protein